MPPPMNPQGSRAGLITAVVVLSILFVTSAIFAFYYSAENNRTTKQLTDRNQIITQYASDEARSDAGIAALAELRNSDQQYAGMSAIQILMAQKNAATQQVAALTGTVNDLTGKLNAAQAENESKDQQLAALTDKIKAEVAMRAQMQAEMNGKFEDQGKQLATALAAATEGRSANDQTVTKIQSETDRALKAAQQQSSNLQKTVTDREGEIAKLQEQLKIAQSKVIRVEDSSQSVIRQPDGQVVRVPGNDNVFINLGMGDRITPGMTFEVYDRFAGVPAHTEEDALEAATAGQVNLPKGKASIEVVRLARGQSECRIIRQEAGKPVVEGDIIANLVYDKNTRYNFVVFGEFDLDQNETPTPGDTEVVKRLITQWGGRLANEVNVNTDFVVLGATPVVPPQEENETATDIDRRRAAEEALNAYNDVVSRARELNVPILNQNRFLYYVGHYEQAQR